MNENMQSQDSEESAIPATELTQNNEGPDVSAPETDAVLPENKVFGMPAVVFRGVAVGFATGLILTGLFRLQDTYFPVIVCGGLGWFISSTLYRRKQHK